MHFELGTIVTRKWIYPNKRSKIKKLKPQLYDNRDVFYVPEVLNVHVNESKKKSTFFTKIFFFQAVKN